MVVKKGDWFYLGENDVPYLKSQVTLPSDEQVHYGLRYYSYIDDVMRTCKWETNYGIWLPASPLAKLLYGWKL